MNKKTEGQLTEEEASTPTEEEKARWASLAYPNKDQEEEQKPSAPEEPEEVPPVAEATFSFSRPKKLVNVDPLGLFEYDGLIYSKRRVHYGGINAVSIKGDKVVVLPPDTLVQPATRS